MAIADIIICSSEASPLFCPPWRSVRLWTERRPIRLRLAPRGKRAAALLARGPGSLIRKGRERLLGCLLALFCLAVSSRNLPNRERTSPAASETLPVQMFGGPLRLAWRDRSLQLQRAAILGAVIDPKKVARETLSRASRRKLPASANRLSSSYGKQAIEVTRRCRQLWKRRENSGRRRRTPGSHCTACTLRPSVE